MHYGELISSLATKAGLKKDDPALVDLLSHAELSKINVNREIEDALERNLMSFEAAKNNPAIAAHYKQGALDPIDKWLTTAMDEFIFDDAAKAEILAERSSYKRVDLFSKKLNELAKASAGDPGKSKQEHKDLIEKINGLNKTIEETKTAHKSELDKIIASNEGDLTDLLLDNHLASYKLAGGTIAPDLKIIAAKAALKNALQSAEGIIQRDGKQLKLVNKDGAKFYDKTNKETDLKSFVAATLAANNLLETGGNGGGGGNSDPKGDPIKTDNVNTNDDAIAQIEAQLAQQGVQA